MSKKQKKGICPDCGAELVYGDLECQGEQIFYKVTCDNCDFSGEERYETIFIEIVKSSI